MLPVGLIGFMLQKELEEFFYANPPYNKLGFRIQLLPLQPLLDQNG